MKTNAQSGVALVSDSDECCFGKLRSAPPPGAQQRAILQPGVIPRGVTDSPIDRFCGPGGPALHRKHFSGWQHCVGAAIVVLALIGCGRQEKASQDGGQTSEPVVISANYPLQYFAQRIGGDWVDPLFLVPPDVDPAYWEPTADDIARMQQADLILLNGAGYEKWRSTISLPESRLVDTSASFEDHYITQDAGVTHQHGPAGEHTHGETAFTTWLDLSQAIQQAQAVEQALARLLPEQSAGFADNFGALTNELASLDRDLLAWGASMTRQPLIASHPVYQYFARRYGLNLRSVHWEPDEVPTAAAWREFDAMIVEHPAQWMIWEGPPMQEAVLQLGQRGIRSRLFEPCGNQPKEGDFLSVMRRNIRPPVETFESRP